MGSETKGKKVFTSCSLDVNLLPDGALLAGALAAPEIIAASEAMLGRSVSVLHGLLAVEAVACP